jgi:hypothetical protein
MPYNLQALLDRMTAQVVRQLVVAALAWSRASHTGGA